MQQWNSSVPSLLFQYLFLIQQLLLHQVAGRDHQQSSSLWASSADVHQAEEMDAALQLKSVS